MMIRPVRLYFPLPGKTTAGSTACVPVAMPRIRRPWLVQPTATRQSLNIAGIETTDPEVLAVVDPMKWTLRKKLLRGMNGDPEHIIYFARTLAYQSMISWGRMTTESAMNTALTLAGQMLDEGQRNMRGMRIPKCILPQDITDELRRTLIIGETERDNLILAVAARAPQHYWVRDCRAQARAISDEMEKRSCWYESNGIMYTVYSYKLIQILEGAIRTLYK